MFLRRSEFCMLLIVLRVDRLKARTMAKWEIRKPHFPFESLLLDRCHISFRKLIWKYISSRIL